MAIEVDERVADRGVPQKAEGDASEVMSLIERLYPICRSITGEGVRRSLKILQDYIPLVCHQVPTGWQVFDWPVPKEWNIRGAYIARLDGTRIVDFADSNLHVVQYSVPLDRIVETGKLRKHLYTLPERPDWIPYRTSYYSEDWGFCLSHRQLETLTDPAYRVVIDATLESGQLSYGELVIPGETTDTVLISAHICHPSLANDNLSGVAVAALLGRYLLSRPRRHTYRLVFAPGTIGALCWLAQNEARLPAVKYGLVLSCLGDGGGFTYKQSRRGNAAIDRIAAHVLRHDAPPGRVLPFVPYGYDERQYCSPGFDLPVGCLMRTPPGGYPEYHTSADTLALLKPGNLAAALALLRRIVGVIEGEGRYWNLSPKGEPQLGRRGLYRPMGGDPGVADRQMALLWVLNLSDGGHSLLDIAERAGLSFEVIREAADALVAAELLEPVCSA